MFDLYKPDDLSSYIQVALGKNHLAHTIGLFLMGLLFSVREAPFYIGGSFATILAHMFQGKEIDLDLYEDSDIDIYCIGPNVSDKTLLEYQNALFRLIAKYFVHLGDVEHYVTIKRYIINICVPFPGRKIQIVLHRKKSIDEHMEFVDLPITQFLLGSNKGMACLYKTRMAQFALDNKINVISDPVNEQTYNRISKYLDRGFQTFVHAKGQSYIMGHSKSRIMSVFELSDYKRCYRHYVDCSFKDLVDCMEIAKNFHLMRSIPVIPNAEIIEHLVTTKDLVRLNVMVNSNMVSSPLFRVLLHNRKIVCTQTEYQRTREAERKRIIPIPSRRRYYRPSRRHRYYDSYSDDDDDDEYEVVVEQYTEISNIKSTNHHSSLLKRYIYKHDESRETFETCQENNLEIDRIFRRFKTLPKQFPFYAPLPVMKLPCIERPLFFNQYCSYFLNNNGLVINRDGSYLVKLFCPEQMRMKVEIATVGRIFPRANNVDDDKYDSDEDGELSFADIALNERDQRDALFRKKQRAHKLGRDKRQMSVDRASAEHSEKSKALYGKKSSKSPKSTRHLKDR
jgi:hypothetical protein